MRGLLMSALLMAGLAHSAGAVTVEEQIRAGLTSQGYVILEEGFTFLGRLRIVAENGQIHRELVVNPGTGEVLRDYAVQLDDIQPRLPVTTTTSHGTSLTTSSSRTSSNTSSGTGDTTGTASAAAGGVVSGITKSTDGPAIGSAGRPIPSLNTGQVNSPDVVLTDPVLVAPDDK
ncbi:MAG: hypothetical protein ABI832_04235 [bacterium]